MKALQDLSERIHRADSLEALVDSILAGLEESFGFRHSMILRARPNRTACSSRSRRAGIRRRRAARKSGYGEGIVGMVAEARKPIRISGLMRGMLYALAMHKRGRRCRRDASASRRVPLPGLRNPESQLGVPLLVRGELVGVLCLESEMPYRFHEEDKASIELLGSYLAIAIQNMQWQERSADAVVDRRRARPRRSGASRQHSGGDDRRTRTRSSTTPATSACSSTASILIRGLPAQDSLAAADDSRIDRTRGVHQPRAASRQVAQPARVEGQPRKPAAAAPATAGTEVS